MRYFNPQEIKNENRAEINKILEHHTGKNLRDSFAINLISVHLIQSGWDKDCNILDLGPAGGRFAHQLSQQGYHNIHSVDIDNYLSNQNKPLIKNFQTADLSFEKIPWPNNFFKMATAWCVLPHLENPFNCVREIYRVLGPQGLFVFSAPNILSKASLDYFLKNKDLGSYKSSNNHLVIFTPAIIEKTILKYFDIVTIEYHIRAKVFNGKFRGRLRRLAYDFTGKISGKIKKSLEKRWAYNAIYVLRKKSGM